MLDALEGVVSHSVSVGSAVVTYDPELVTAAEIAQAIEDEPTRDFEVVDQEGDCL